MTDRNEECLLKLSAHLDDELAGDDLECLRNELASQPAGKNDVAEWTAYRQFLRDSTSMSVPDKAEMLAKINVRIQDDDSSVISLRSWSRRWMAAAAALILLLGGYLWMGPLAPALAVPVMWVETHVPDSSAVVYEDQETGVTVIWMITDNHEMQDG